MTIKKWEYWSYSIGFAGTRAYWFKFRHSLSVGCQFLIPQARRAKGSAKFELRGQFKISGIRQNAIFQLSRFYKFSLTVTVPRFVLRTWVTCSLGHPVGSTRHYSRADPIGYTMMFFRIPSPYHHPNKTLMECILWNLFMMFLICSSVGVHMVQNIWGTVRWYQQRPRLCGFPKISIQSRYSNGICGPYKWDSYIYIWLYYIVP